MEHFLFNSLPVSFRQSFQEKVGVFFYMFFEASVFEQMSSL